MIAIGFWQSILSAFGAVLSFLYDIVGNYGVAIILLTVLVRIVLLPLTIKQTRSMQDMQRIQPLIKEIQRKHKGNRQKMNEEMMKLYREHRVNPLGGCLPLVMQLPVFFALYAVLRGDPNKAPKFPPIAHLPAGSALAVALQAGHAKFLGMNLACSPSQAGRGLFPLVKGGPTVLNCGSSWTSAIPFFVLVALMVATTWYQQKQMQSMSGQVNPQMQIMGRIMPVLLGFISLQIPGGVLLYWVTTNLWQVGQQQVMIRRGMMGPASGDGARTKGDGARSKGGPNAVGKSIPKRVTGPKQQSKKPEPGRGGGGRDGGGNRKKRRKR